MNDKMQTMPLASLTFTVAFAQTDGAPAVCHLGMQVPRPWSWLRDRELTAH